MKRKLRIGFVDYVLEPDKPGASGLSDIVWDMASALFDIGHEVHVIASYHTRRYPDNRIIVHNFQTPPIGYRNIIGHIWILKNAAKVIGNLSLDILHTPEYVSSAVLSMLGIDIPIILTVPGNIFERIENGNPFDPLTTQVLITSAKISSRKCNKVIVTSSKMEEWWKKTGVPQSKMRLVPYGVNIDRFKPNPEARSELKIPSERKIVLFVGRISHEKGLDYLISAMKLLCRIPIDLELHLIGTGNEQKHIQGLVHHLGIESNVVFHGQILKSNLPMFYSAADLTILPSLSEGLPRTMLEALACESPFLGTKITGIEDHIVDQKTGYLVNPKNAEELAQKIASVLDDPIQAKRVARSGSNYVRSNLSWEKIAHRIQDEVYYGVLGD
jgi:glycosyltransferase involved in cell wall biosynthesis